jgi:hypothetical protein
MAGKTEEWMEETKAIDVAGSMRVLEDGQGLYSSESAAQYSDHGEELTGMYTSEMLDENGNPVLNRATIPTEQADQDSFWCGVT